METHAIKEGIHRFLMRPTVESWGLSGYLDGLRAQDKRSPNSNAIITSSALFAAQLWNAMDAKSWLERDCENPYSPLWAMAVTELVREKVGIEWIKENE